jgi:hypothetical protein
MKPVSDGTWTERKIYPAQTGNCATKSVYSRKGKETQKLNGIETA